MPKQRREKVLFVTEKKVPQKAFFLLEEKKLRTKSKNSKKTFVCGTASEASGGGAFKIRSPDFCQKKFDFNEKVPPSEALA